MKKIFTDNSFTIGNTPLVRLNKIGNGLILAKIESRNPSFSVKCRIGANMIWNAEKKGILNKNKIILEATSGNTGIALAFIAAARSHKLKLVIPDSISTERIKLLKSLGASLKFTPGAKGMKESIKIAKDIYKKNNKKYLLLNQFSNKDNTNIHIKTTGPEIIKNNKNINILIAGVGTGGTITGISKYIKNIKNKNIITVAVEPFSSQVIKQTLLEKKIKTKPHKIQGIGTGFIPKILDLTLINKVISVTNEEAIFIAHRLMKEEGILSGISSGAALAAALKLQREKYYRNKNLVIILPSSSERYLSTVLFNNYF